MRIIESYLNEYRECETDKERSPFSNKMTKYIIGSCFRKMHHRAFQWVSYFMIGSLTKVYWYRPSETIAIKPDPRIPKFLNSSTGTTTYGKWLMTFHPYKSPDKLLSLDDFLTPASASSDYQFNSTIAAIFHDLLLSSLYAYLCMMMQLNRQLKLQIAEKIQKYAGLFSNIEKFLYLLLHSNAMKAYFTHQNLPLAYPTYDAAARYKSDVINGIHKTLGVDEEVWTRENVLVEVNGGYKDNNGGDEEDPCPVNDVTYVEDIEKNDLGSFYRRSLLRLVDHYTGLRLLERRSLRLLKEEKIKLSLIAVKKPNARYFPWREIEKVIHRTCKDFGSKSTTSNPIEVEGKDMVEKIKKYLARIEIFHNTNTVINSFKELLRVHDEKIKQSSTQYPPFDGSIHCESSLAAILSQIHAIPNNSEPDLLKLFPSQACPSSLIFLHSLTCDSDQWPGYKRCVPHLRVKILLSRLLGAHKGHQRDKR